jgi:hypothetical protein
MHEVDLYVKKYFAKSNPYNNKFTTIDCESFHKVRKCVK